MICIRIGLPYVQMIFKFSTGRPKKVPTETTIFLNVKITKFDINMNIIMRSNLCVSGFFPVNLGSFH